MEIHKNLLFLFIKILQFCQKTAITTHIIYFKVCDVNIEKYLLKSSGDNPLNVFQHCGFFDVGVDC